MKIGMEMRLELQSFRERVAAIELIPPLEFERRLLAFGYRGQEEARRAVALAAYRHVRRLQRRHLKDLAPRELGARQNLLLAGPTGSGKSHLIELAFQELLHVPVVIEDATRFTETGYVGEEVESLLYKLHAAAGGDVQWAGCGVIVLDEVDKIASGRSNAKFGGAQTNKDISGFGVQRSLLALMSNMETELYPPKKPNSSPSPEHLDLSCLTFVAAGAFSGLVLAKPPPQSRPPVGFGREPEVRLLRRVGPSDLQRYGLMAELVGRFTRIIEFEPLSRDTLRAILIDGVLGVYQAEFSAEGVDLYIGDGVLDDIVDEAIDRGHGARGLHAELAGVLERVAFGCFGSTRRGSVAIRLSHGQVIAEHDEGLTAHRKL